MSENNFFTLENRDNIITLTMNAPGNNLMTGDFISDFIDTVSEIKFVVNKNQNIKGLIVRGSGRHFSVGADVNSLVSRTSDELSEIERTGDLPEGFKIQKEVFTSLGSFPFPTVSVVSGFCIGSGSEIAVNTNFRICEPTARAGQPESTFGILPALGGIARTAEICGLADAVGLVMSGDLLGADALSKIGWADIMCGKKAGYDTAVRFINYIDSTNCEFNIDKRMEYLNGFAESEKIYESV